MARHWATGLALALLVEPIPSFVEAKDRPIRLPVSEARCIADHLQTYLRQARDPLIFFPGTCPRIDVTERGLTSGATASTGVVIPRHEGTGILVLTKSEIACLANRFRAFIRTRPKARIFQFRLEQC